MLVVLALRGLGMSPMLGTLNAVIVDASAYTFQRSIEVHLDGTMFSCSSNGDQAGRRSGNGAVWMAVKLRADMKTAQRCRARLPSA